jgi:uncharacterized phiE125 gp8 family phage protein
MEWNSRWVIPESRLRPDLPQPLHRETRTTAPTGRPVTAAELDSYARLDGIYSEGDRNAAIDSATAFVEAELGYAVLSQTWTMTIQNIWPREGVMPMRRPFGAVASIRTVRPEGTNEAWAESVWYVAPGQVVRATSSAPVTLADDDWIEIIYTAGHADAASVPENLKQAIEIIAAETLVWSRDIGAMPNMWPGNSWALAKDFMAFRGVG